MTATNAMCGACDADTYRSGDATPENNVCLAIPAGYYASSGTDTHVTAIAPCAKGEISFYSGGARQPAGTPQLCQACTLNTYAPRIGMANCLPCDGGTTPNVAHDACTACATNDYRSFNTAT